MKQYIEKSIIMAKIRTRLLPVIRDKHYDEWEEGQDSERIAILNIIDSLETKEVDLEKEFYDFLDTLTGKDNGHLSEDELFRIAEYFYELGLNTHKDE